MARYLRKVIRVRAEDSPNVRRALDEIGRGLLVSHAEVLPGVLTYAQYVQRRALWDKVRQCIGLDGEFWEGGEFLLYPPEWLNRAEQLAEGLRGRVRRARAIGIDPAAGGDKTAMAAVDEFGLIDLVAYHTPDTAVIRGDALAFIHRHGVPYDRVCFDAGGGGKQIADDLRDDNYKVRIVAFGAPPTLELKRGVHMLEARKEVVEERYVYANLRAEMYGELSVLLDLGASQRTETMDGVRVAVGGGFAIPSSQVELRRQMSLIPKKYDKEGGKLKIPSKDKPSRDSKEPSLKEILGCSPDELDALVLAVHGMMHKARAAVATGA